MSSPSDSRRAGANSDDKNVDAEGECFVLARPDHPISRKHIDESALKVLYRLHNADYEGFLVGGSVRDLMLGIRPKDFDVTTDARPAEIRRLFRNSRIIGRRFRLVHVMFRDVVVEVATFRGDPDPDVQKRREGELIITNDNTFGSPREDAFRRDFTINALFYDISDYSVLDYVGGLDDLEESLVRVIGDPDLRFQEDPVRMLRACEFAGRLDFDIEEETFDGILRNRHEIKKASSVRLTEELLQLLRSGAATPTLEWAADAQLLELMLPEVEPLVAENETGGRGDENSAAVVDFRGLLPAIDEAVDDGGAYSDATLLAALLAPSVIARRFAWEDKKGEPASRGRLRQLTEEVVSGFSARFALSNQRSHEVFNTLETFHRLCEPIPEDEGQAARLVTKGSFADALDLFELMVAATQEGQEALDQWRELARRSRRRSNRAPKAKKTSGRGRRSRGGRRRGGPPKAR